MGRVAHATLANDKADAQKCLGRTERFSGRSGEQVCSVSDSPALPPSTHRRRQDYGSHENKMPIMPESNNPTVGSLPDS